MNNDLSSWSPCEGEELQSLGRDLRQKGRAEANAAITRKFLATAAAVALLALSITTIQGMSPPGNITCSECYQGFASYAEHLEGTQELATDQATAMHLHLANCPHCRDKFETKYPGLLTTAAQTATLGIFGMFLLFSRYSPMNRLG